VGILICISALGAMNGLVLTGARISYAMGTDHQLLSHLGKWDDALGTPVRALTLQGLFSLAIVLLAGSFLDTVLYTAPVVWAFFLATAASLFILRHREPFRNRPYTVTGYPYTALIFCSCSIFMLYSSFSYALTEVPVGVVTLSGFIGCGAITYGLAGRTAVGSKAHSGSS